MKRRQRRTLLLVMWGCAAAVAASLGLAARAEPHSSGASRSPKIPPAQTSVALDTRATPWGDVETKEFALELSDELIPEALQLLREPRWCFPGYSLEQVTNLLRSCAFDAVALERIMRGVEWELAMPTGRQVETHARSIDLDQMDPVSVTVLPPLDTVLNLDPAVRQRLYSVLATTDQNPSQRSPFRFSTGQFEEWFRQAGLPAEKLAQVKGLAYWNGQVTCLADLAPLEQVLTPAEMARMLKAVYRNPTYVMRLQVSSETDLGALTRYWGRGGRARMIKPFLEGLAKTPGQSSVNVAFLLPAFARTRLYTFPDPAKEPSYPKNGGLWTALNFFNEQPDNRYLEREYAREVLRANFETGSHSATYGDLVALYSAEGTLVHVGVYIADDVVFARSGRGDLQPWVLVKIPELLRRFQALGAHQTVIHHRKEA